MRSIKLIGALSTGNREQLKEITDNIGKQLLAVGGIFLAINGGIVLALRSITRLASFLTQVAVTNLLIKPIKLIFKIAKAAALAIAGGIAAILILKNKPILKPIKLVPKEQMHLLYYQTLDLQLVI